MPRILAAGEDLAMGERGANVEKRNLQGQTALIVACIAGNLEAVRLLLDCGANIEASDTAGATCLMWACFYSHLEIVHLLLERGANTKIARLFFLLCQRLTEVDAEYARREEVLLTIIRHDKYGWINSIHDEKGRSCLLHLACLKRGVHMITRIGGVLIENGADLEARRQGKTPLLAAVENNHIELVKLLLASGANVEAKSGGRTTLLFAIARNKSRNRNLQVESEELVRILLASGANVEARDGVGITPLIHAARSHFCAPGILKLLLEQKPNVNEVTRLCSSTCRTALFWAVHNADATKVKMLLDAGACPNIGESPLIFACRGLHECYRKMSSSFVMTKEHKTEMVRLLLSANANAHAIDPEGNSPLQLAKKNHLDQIVVLLEQHLAQKASL